MLTVTAADCTTSATRMSELKDSFFMLFGKTIAFPPTHVSDANDCVASDHNLSSASDSASLEQELDPDHRNSLSIDQQLNKEPCKDKEEEATSGQISGKLKDAMTLASNNDNPKTPSVDLETSPPSKTESDTEDRTLKKPDTIVPCPRCNSMDTKFCYYNNYNVKQPRHFCKNCQRYWTAGGTMRSVPVGAGRRKNKNATASHYRHIMVSDALQMEKIRNNPPFGNSGSVLTFGSDSSQIQNGFHRPDQRVLVPCGGKDNGDDHSSGCGSSITASSSSDKVDNSGLQEARVKDCQAFPPQVPCFPGPAWHYGWNSTLHPAAFSPVFYPAPAYWGCTVMGSWDMSHASPPSTVLGKHLRDEKPVNESNTSGRSVWIPNTHEQSGRGLFKAFQSGNGKYQAVGAPAALRANPAALSRSLNFQEST